LHVITHARNQNDDGDVGQAHDVDFILADADGFDQDEVAAGGIEHAGDVGGGTGQAAQRSACGHAADVDARVGVVVLHADAVAQNRAAGVGTGGVDGNDAQGAAGPAVELSQLVDQRALAGSWRAGQAEDAGAAAEGEQRLEQIGASGGAVLHRADGARQGPGIAGAQALVEAGHVATVTEAFDKYIGRTGPASPLPAEPPLQVNWQIPTVLNFGHHDYLPGGPITGQFPANVNIPPANSAAPPTTNPPTVPTPAPWKPAFTAALASTRYK
jgi:hypothetical protein